MMPRPEQLNELVLMLHRAAAARQSCPTNEAISRHFGYATPKGGMGLIRDLEAAGRITVERTRTSRVVTVIDHTVGGLPARTAPLRRSAAGSITPPAVASIGKPRISAAVIRAAKVDGRDLPTFVTALIEMGLHCWHDDRTLAGESAAIARVG